MTAECNYTLDTYVLWAISGLTFLLLIILAINMH